jgi:hypothetical protein
MLASPDQQIALTDPDSRRSLTLTAFGLDSVIELASACVLIWRLKTGRRFPPSLPPKILAGAR